MPNDHEAAVRRRAAVSLGEIGMREAVVALEEASPWRRSAHELGVREPGDYERVWIEAATPKPEVTAEARKELLDLAALAGGADDLCSTFFPLFVEGYQQGTGGEPSHAVRWFAKQVEKLRAMGVHCSSSAIATLLRELANP
jgi:hypothetical protein